MLQPKKTKYRKMMKGRMRGTETRGTKLEFGHYGLQAVEPGWITSRQIEAARKIFPDKPITAKPAETRMGSGKGNVEYWVSVVKPNRIMFELEYFDKGVATHALELAAQKLPIKTKIVVKTDEA